MSTSQVSSRLRHIRQVVLRPHGGRGAVSANALGLLGRQVILLFVSLAIARLIGPDAFGISAQAQMVTVFVAMVLDQGISAALIRIRDLDEELVGASMGLNLVLSAVLASGVVLCSWWLSEVLRSPGLQPVLMVLGAFTFVKGISIVPRAVLVRELKFGATAYSDIVSAVLGGTAGVLLAILGAGIWAIVVQLILTDLVATVALTRAAGFPRPNLRWSCLRENLSFSTQVLFSNISSFAGRNSDNILIGRYLGANQLGLYGLAYKVLMVPLQMLNQVVSQVLYPLLSRAETAEQRRTIVRKSVQGLSFTSLPPLTLVCVAANDIIDVGLGDEWSGAAAIVMVLALTAARQSITSVNSPVLMAQGRADLLFRFSLLASFVQVGGIVLGLNWGALGVAIGYSVAGLALHPVVMMILSKYGDFPVKDQLRTIAPPLHISLWMAAAYLLPSVLLHSSVFHLLLGVPLAGVVGSIVAFAIHRKYLKSVVAQFARGRKS